MKKILVALSALAISTAAASAADLPTKAPPAPPPPPCIWCGFYIGLNGGWAVGNGRGNFFAIDNDEGALFGPVNEPFFTNHNPNGGFGGGQVGYNWASPTGWQGGYGWLLGVEADIQGASLRSSQSGAFFAHEEGNTISASIDSRI